MQLSHPPPTVHLQIIYSPPKRHKAHLPTQIRPTIAPRSLISRSEAAETMGADSERHLNGRETAIQIKEGETRGGGVALLAGRGIKC